MTTPPDTREPAIHSCWGTIPGRPDTGTSQVPYVLKSEYDALRAALTAITDDRDAQAELAGSCAAEVLELRSSLTARDELLLELKGVFAGEAAPHWVNKFDTTCMRGHWLDRIDNLLGAK